MGIHRWKPNPLNPGHLKSGMVDDGGWLHHGRPKPGSYPVSMFNVGELLCFVMLVCYPLVNCPIAMERSTMLLMGTSTISTGPFSIAATCMFTRGYVQCNLLSGDMSYTVISCNDVWYPVIMFNAIAWFISCNYEWVSWIVCGILCVT